MTTFSPISPSQFDVLGDEPIRWFRDWPDASVPMFAAGVYTIWDGELGFVYVGMSGRSIRPGDAAMDRRHGLVTRLHSHAQGRRSGDQFCVYVADRFVLPALSREDIDGIASGRHSLDAYVRRFIHARLGYRYLLCSDGVEARAIEGRLRRGQWRHGQPLLNPHQPAP